MNSLGVAYFQSGQLQPALQAFLSAERLNPKDKQVLNNLKAVYNQLGNAVKVQEYTRKSSAN